MGFSLTINALFTKVSQSFFNREILWVFFAQFGGLVGGLIGLKVLTNVLNGDQFGIYQLGWSAAIIMSYVLYTPLGLALIRLHAVHAEDGNAHNFWKQTLKSTLFVSFVILLIGSVCSLLLNYIFDLNFGLSIGSLFLIVCFGISTLLLNCQTALRFRATYAIGQIGVAFGRPLFGALVVLLFAGFAQSAIVAIWGSMIFLFVFNFVQLFLIEKNFATKKAEFSPSFKSQEDTGIVAPDFWTVSRPFIYMGFLTMLSMQADRWVLGLQVSLVEIGIYAAAYQLASAPINFAYGIAQRLSLPAIFDSMGKGVNQERRLLAKKQTQRFLYIWSFLIFVPILVTMFLHRLIMAIATNQEFAEYSFVLVLLVVGMALEKTSQVLTVKGNLNWQFSRYLPARLVHVVILLGLGFYLSSQMGIYGFAYAHVCAGAAILLITLVTNFKMQEDESLAS